MRAHISLIAALFLATGTAHADELPKAIYGSYCWEQLNDSQILYKRGECSSLHWRNGAFFTSTTYKNWQDVSCEFTEIKKITATIYQVHANCINRHTIDPEEFIVFIELEILRRGRGLLITYLSEG